MQSDQPLPTDWANYGLAVMWAAFLVLTARRGPDLTDIGAMLFAYFLGRAA